MSSTGSIPAQDSAEAGQPANNFVDVLVIGAGPAGSLASVLLNNGGIRPLVLEKQKFPRFSIGESLLPQLMVFLEKAGMVDAVKAGGYQHKNGAAFSKNGVYSEFNFEEKFSVGPGTTFQVKRADFDKRLADHAEQQGIPIRYEHEVTAIQLNDDHCLVDVLDEKGEAYQVKAGFVLDASGFGRVLPRLLDLEYPSQFPARQSIFCHMRDNITDPSFDRFKILISVHPENTDVWYWLIPFADGTCSFGVVGTKEFFEGLDGDLTEKLNYCRAAEPRLRKLLEKAELITEVRSLAGYSCNVKSLHGKNFALLGNAGEFLDPVFSSGVTIAFKSADLASALLLEKKHGKEIDWEQEYAKPLKQGVDTFRTYVNAWYDGSLQDVIFHQNSSKDIKEKISAILAGYAWDTSNPYVEKAERRLKVLAELCRQ